MREEDERPWRTLQSVLHTLFWLCGGLVIILLSFLGVVMLKVTLGSSCQRWNRTGNISPCLPWISELLLPCEGVCRRLRRESEWECSGGRGQEYYRLQKPISSESFLLHPPMERKMSNGFMCFKIMTSWTFICLYLQLSLYTSASKMKRFYHFKLGSHFLLFTDRG